MLLFACNGVLGLEERPARVDDVTAAGGSSGGGGTTNVVCPDEVCERHLPADWSGPTLVSVSEAGPLSCDESSASPNAELTLVDDIDGEPATCSCTCGDPVGIDCNNSPITVTTFTNDTCTNQHRTGSGVLGQCIDLCCGGLWGYYDPAVADVSNASCPPEAVVDIAEVSWGRDLIGCGPVPRRACGDEDCFEPSDATLCIYRQGDHTCPAGPFSDKTLWHAGFDDSRACEPCACSPVTAQCNEVVEGYAVPDCNNVLEDFMMPAPVCDRAPGDWDGAEILSVNPTGTCTPSGGVATGEVTPTTPTTVCCTTPP